MLAKINKRYVPAYWDDFLNDSFFNDFGTQNQNGSAPAVNILEDDSSFIIEMAVPGMTRKDFRIDLDKDVLTISSEQEEEKKENKTRYMRREFSYSTFKRSFQLPESIDVEKIRASHNEGILRVELPKREELVQKAPKQIEIK